VGTPVGRWISINVAARVDPWLMKATRGRVGMGLVLPSALLETRGARTGQTRRNAVIYFHDGDEVIIIASNNGLPRHPNWYHNLRTNPDVTFGGIPFQAKLVEDEQERERIWKMADLVFPPYAAYRERTKAVGRRIPIVRLNRAANE
jgi:deazaflavin-dependent oxidoreductase (nitroreductase family)